MPKALQDSVIANDELILYDRESMIALDRVVTRHEHANLLEEIRSDMRIGRLGALDGVFESILEDIMMHFVHGDLAARHQLDPVRSIMLIGPPGVGKTSLMHAVANELAARAGVRVRLYCHHESSGRSPTAPQYRVGGRAAASFPFEQIVGASPVMWKMYSRIRRIAPHFRTVLITGPTGSGKDLVAQSLHKLSPAAAGSFGCQIRSAVVETLFESELFGHVKGAFTGATADKVGLVEHANGGFLFLDEIGADARPQGVARGPGRRRGG